MYKKLALIAGLLLYSSNAAAFFDMEYITHGTFQSTVDAFKRSALMFNLGASPVRALVFVFFVTGAISAMGVAAFNTTAGQLTGQSNSKVMPYLLSAVVGAVIVTATVSPKNTVHIYDREFNRYESVGNVPSLIVFVAGVTNKTIEAWRHVTAVSTAYPYGQLSSGTPFKLIRAVMNDPNRFYSKHLEASIGNYYMTCGSMANAQKRIDLEKIRYGTENIITELAKATHNSVNVEYYSKDYPAGLYTSCTDAWNKIQTDMNDPNLFDNHLGHICQSMGLDSKDAHQRVTCQGKIQDVFGTAYDITGGINYKQVLQNSLAAAAISNSVIEGDVDGAIRKQLHRNAFAKAEGGWTAVSEYMPYIKGMMFTIIMMACPFLVFMMMTPLMGVALKTFLTLFLFYLVWELMDVSLVYAMEDAAHAAMHELTQSKFGIVSLWNSPSASMKALAILGQNRSISMTLATLICVSIFRISAHAMAGMAQKAESDLERGGEQLGQDVGLQENAGRMLDGMSHGNSALLALGKNGGMMPQIQGDAANRAISNQAGQKLSGMEGQISDANALNQQSSSTEAAQKIDSFGGMSSAANAIGSAAATESIANTNAVNSNANSQDALQASKAAHIATGEGYVNASNQGVDVNQTIADQTQAGVTKEASMQDTLGDDLFKGSELQGKVDASTYKANLNAEEKGIDVAKVAENQAESNIVHESAKQQELGDNLILSAHLQGQKSAAPLAGDLKAQQDGIDVVGQTEKQAYDAQVKESARVAEVTKQGKTTTQVANAEGTHQGASQSGHVDGMNSVSTDAIAASSEHAVERTATEANVIESQTGGNSLGYFDSKATHDVGSELHRQDKLDTLSKIFGTNPQDTVAMLDGSTPINFTEQSQADAALANGIIDQSQYNEIANNGWSGAVTSHFGKGMVYAGDTDLNTGNSVHRDDRNVFESQTEISSGTKVDSQNVTSTGERSNMGYETNNAQTAFQKPEELLKAQKAEADALGVSEKDKDAYSSVVHRTNAKMFTEGVEGAIQIQEINSSSLDKHASGSVTVSTPTLFGLNPVSAQATTGVNASNNDQTVNTLDLMRQYGGQTSERISDVVDQMVEDGKIPESQRDITHANLMADHNQHVVEVISGERENPLDQSAIQPFQTKVDALYNDWADTNQNVPSISIVPETTTPPIDKEEREAVALKAQYGGNVSTKHQYGFGTRPIPDGGNANVQGGNGKPKIPSGN